MQVDSLEREAAPKCFCNIVTLVSRRQGRMPTRERGRPARTTLAKPRPSPRPGSTGKDARALLRPGPCGSHRHGERVRHRRETERQPKGEDAGGTPALPGGSSRWWAGGYLAGDLSESRPAPFGKLPFAKGPGPATLPRGGSNEGETTNLPGLSGTRTLTG